jgi:hypothetical protein
MIPDTYANCCRASADNPPASDTNGTSSSESANRLKRSGFGQGRRRHAANGAEGANVNRLMSSAPEDLEKLAGMARVTGVPVRVSRS